MGVVWIVVIGAGMNAKAMAFMYSEVVAPTASLRHYSVTEMLPANTVGYRTASCVRLAVSHCQVLLGAFCSFTSLLSEDESGDQI